MSQAKLTVIHGDNAHAINTVLMGRYTQLLKDQCTQKTSLEVGCIDAGHSLKLNTSNEWKGIESLEGAYNRNIDDCDVLFIQMPETGLSPAGQLSLTRWIVRQVNAGKSITISTHSDWILGEINFCTMLTYGRGFEDKIRQFMDKTGYLQSECLAPTQLEAFHAYSDGTAKQHIVEELGIDGNRNPDYRLDDLITKNNDKMDDLLTVLGFYDEAEDE